MPDDEGDDEPEEDDGAYDRSNNCAERDIAVSRTCR